MKRKRVEEAPMRMRLVKRTVSDYDQGVTVEANLNRVETERPRTDKQNGVAFLKMVKEMLKDEVDRYDSFVKIMQNFKRGLIGTREVIRRVRTLFKKHPNLILGFNIFLQPCDRIEVPTGDEVDVEKLKIALRFVNKEEPPAQPSARENSKGAQERKTESASDRPGPEKVADDAGVKDSKKTGADVVKSSKKHDGYSISESNGVKYCEEGQDQYQDQDQVHAQEKLVCRRRRKRLELAAPEPEAQEQKRKRHSNGDEPDEAAQLAFFETINVELEGSSVYKEFLQSMSLCRLQIITSSQLEVLVSDVLHEHPHLQKAFHKCFPSNRKEPNLILDQWQTCTPSYRLHEHSLSEKASTSSESQADEDISGPYSTEGVLNNTWVTLTTGGNAFTSQESNKYEEILFRCEDDQYELDMLMETTRSTAARVAECIEMLRDTCLTKFNLNDHLTPVHLRCIERIYNPIYPTLLVHTQASPATALPVILSRLQQRLEDWKITRTRLNKLWAKVRESNHSKSLIYESDLELGAVVIEDEKEAEQAQEQEASEERC